MTTPPRQVRRRKLGALRLVREDAFDAPSEYPRGSYRCSAPESVVRFMRPYVEREEVEVFWLLALTTRSTVIWNRPLTVTRGLLDSALVHPREVFRLAIHAGAAGLIAVHNHPSGDPTPSAEDRAVTRQLVAAGQLLGIPVYDHLIIAGERFISFATAGLL